MWENRHIHTVLIWESHTASIWSTTVTIESIKPELGTMYNGWAADFGLSGTNAASTADPDGDSLNNLYEYGLGGNPTNSALTGYSTTVQVAAEGGTNWFYVVHPERNDAANAGLTYSLETDDNLVTAPGWTNATYEVLGTTPDGFSAGFNAVTNRVSTEGKSKEFIHLLIEGAGL